MDGRIFEACWIPSWYGSDRSVKVGETRDLLFFKETPDNLASTDMPVLFNLDWPRESECNQLRCTVLAMSHPQLGALSAVDVESMHCIFTLASGERIWADSEQAPGQAYNPPRPDITDWSLTVTMKSAVSATGNGGA
jgi:hypothetical protein